MVDQQDSNEFQSVPKRSGSRKRIYIGNLPTNCENLEDKLVQILKEKAECSVSPSDITVSSSKTCHAFVSCSGKQAVIIRKLHRSEFEGKRLVVQRERKRREFPSDGKKESGFAGSSWSKPSEDDAQEMSQDALVPEKDLDPAAQVIGEIVSDEIDNAERNGQHPMNAAIVSTATVSLVAAVSDFGVQNDTGVVNNKDSDNTDFRERYKQPLSTLMSDYGEMDPNWKKQPSNAPSSPVSVPQNVLENRLAQHGKAPIHVEFSSFGYHHGAPPEIRSDGWSHANPLPPFDCRGDLLEIPHYMAWQDGLSGAVKRELLKADSPNVRDFANDIAEQVAGALAEAIDTGGHGYVLPLRMTIYTGSESGRHRSVVASELAATALRKILRENRGDRIAQPVSVGTRHRDLDRKVRRDVSSRSKQKDLEDEW